MRLSDSPVDHGPKSGKAEIVPDHLEIDAPVIDI